MPFTTLLFSETLHHKYKISSVNKSALTYHCIDHIVLSVTIPPEYSCAVAKEIRLRRKIENIF